MRWWWTVMLAVGCASTPKEVGDDDDDNGTATGHTGHTGFVDTYEFEPWEPAAVGFELEAVVLSDGTLRHYVSDGYEVGPWLILTFTSLAYFSAETAEEAEAQSCVAFGRFDPSPLVAPAAIPLIDPAPLWLSYDHVVTIEYSDCGGKVNPDTWAYDASILLNKFQGAHVGIGFGELTDYLREYWDEQTLTDLGDSMFAEYIALNDSNGVWLGDDWTTGIAFAWDPATEELVVDADDYLTAVDISGAGYGVFPESYVRSFSYWYQDFPYLDLENLSDGAP